MKRCPKCGATYGLDAAWCPLDGTQLHDDRDDLHTLGEDVDAGHTMRDLPQSPLSGGGSLTMGWEIPEVPTTAPGAVIPGPKPSTLTMGWEIPEIPETPTTVPGAVIPGPKPMPSAPSPLTMGWEIPEVPDSQPRTTPTQLAAIAVPSTLPGVKPDRLKASTLPPAAPRMTPKSLAAALAKAPAPHRPEPIQTPTSVNVPTPEPEPPRFVAGLAETEPFEPLDPEPVTFVAAPPRISEPIEAPMVPSRISEPIDPPTFATPPLDVADVDVPAGSSLANAAPALGPPPNLVAEPRRPSQSKSAPVRRLITEPMPSVASMERTPAIEVVPVQPPSESMESQPVADFTAPVAQVSVELRAPITMPGIVAPEIRVRTSRPSESPPMSEPVAVAAVLNQPSGAMMRPPAPAGTSRWMWIAIALIVVGGAVGTIIALQ